MVLYFDLNFKIWKIFDVWFYNDVIFVFSSAKPLKAENVIMPKNSKLMLVFELNGLVLVSILNFSSISVQMASFHISPEQNPDRYLL